MVNDETKGLSDELAKFYLDVRLTMLEGYPPTVRELAEKHDISTGTVVKRIRKLIALGLLERVKGKNRALRLLKRTA